MQQLLEGLVKFRRDIFDEKKDLFQQLSSQQEPDILFIHLF